jgi:hypothetical protein
MRGHASLDSFGTILAGLATRLGLESKLFEGRLRRQWPELVGETVAQHTRPGQIRFKKLYIHVHNSVWLQQLTFLKPALLQKVNELAGERLVTEIVLRIGDIVHEPAVTPSAADHVATLCLPPPDLMAEAARHSAAIQDVELRERLAAVMAQALSSLAARPRF